MLKSLTSIRDVFYTLLEFDLAHLREYSETNEVQLLEEKLRFQKSVDEVAEKLSDADKELYYDFHSDEYWKIAEIFPSILRKSLFLIAYSLIEHRMTKLCLSYKRERKTVLSLKDIQGKGIQRCQVYMKKVLLIPFPDEGKEWKDIIVLNRIRNIVAHNDGIFDGNAITDDIRDFVSHNVRYIELTDMNTLLLHEGFVQLALDKINGFFKLLYEKLPDK